MRRRADGSTGRFRIFQDAYDTLAKRDGWIYFAAYRPRGRGIEVLRSKMTRARTLRLSDSDFYPSGHHRGPQIKLSIEEVFQ
ncbi:hypothetical protein GCM10009549_57950 [Streptomyces thermoalcalitolerans]